MTRVGPRTLYRAVAITEACTWAGLLGGMFLKYVTDSTEVGVQVFGPLHGIAFIAYCLATVVVAVDQRWRAGRILAGLLCAIPPFATVPFERYAERAGALDLSWRLADAPSATALERPARWLIRRPAQGAAAGAAAVAVLTALALIAGPPVG